MQETERYNSNSRSGGLGVSSTREAPNHPIPEGFTPRVIKSDMSGIHIEKQKLPKPNSSRRFKK